MENITVAIARIYFEYGESIDGQSFWARLWSSSLGESLLKKAKEADIWQANIFTARSGYLNYDHIIYNISELPALRNPACLELVDEEGKIRKFLELNKEYLKKARIILINPNTEFFNT